MMKIIRDRGYSSVKTITEKYYRPPRGYAEAVLDKSVIIERLPQDRLAEAKPDLVLFVPDKSRVYSGLFDDGALDSLPNAQWGYLFSASTRLGVPALNLTDPLVDQARKILPEGRTIFWRDDTHWNREGIAVGARQLTDALRSIDNGNCRAAISASS